MSSPECMAAQPRRPPSADDWFWAALEAEPSSWTLDDFMQLAVNAVEAGASDITFQTDQPVTLQLAGRQLAATRRPLTGAEVYRLVTGMYASASVPNLLAQLRVLDFSWEIRVARNVRRRFRVNATAILARRGGNGVEVSLRALPDVTPTPEEVGLPEELCRLLSPASGLVVVAGATGQGKSTTLAALVGRHLGAPRAVKIVDIQAPIEFTYSDLRNLESGSSIGQSEVGIHVGSFAAGVRSALRRSPDIIMIGEVRDPETARAAVDAALTGHLVYTTLHAGDVPEIFHRLVALLSAGSGTVQTATVDVLHTFRAGIAQRLLRSAAALRRRPVREIAVVDPDLRAALRSTDPERWPAVIARELDAAPPGTPGRRPFRADIAALLESGEIDAGEAGLHL